MNKLIALCAVVMVSACTCHSTDQNSKKLANINIDEIISAKEELLPDMCSLVPKSELAKILGVAENNIIENNSTPSGNNPKQTTCFFKWDDPNFSNSAIMIQAMRNPLGDEYPNYIVEMINVKRSNGEMTIGDKEPNLFTDLESAADEAIYSAEIGKYFWRFSDKVIIHLAFNTSHNPEEQKKIGINLGDKMIEYYLDLN